jgi:hypothetical protein
MAIVHRFEDEELNETSLAELFQALGERDTPLLYDRPYRVDASYDIATGAGNSNDRNTVYVDRGLYAELMGGAFNETGLTPEQILYCWIDHEHVEKCIVDGDNPIDLYEPAHKRALKREHEHVLTILGKNNAKDTIKRYEQAIWPALERAYNRRPQRVPSDLWVGPIIDELDEDERAKRLIAAYEKMDVEDARKRSKFNVHYGYGEQRCDHCRNWAPGQRQDQNGQLAACRVVAGLVRADRHCDFWMPFGLEKGFHPSQIDARQAGDGKWYVRDRDRPGKYLEVTAGE